MSGHSSFMLGYCSAPYTRSLAPTWSQSQSEELDEKTNRFAPIAVHDEKVLRSRVASVHLPWLIVRNLMREPVRSRSSPGTMSLRHRPRPKRVTRLQRGPPEASGGQRNDPDYPDRRSREKRPTHAQQTRLMEAIPATGRPFSPPRVVRTTPRKALERSDLPAPAAGPSSPSAPPAGP